MARIPIKYAEPFGPKDCRREAAANLRLARRVMHFPRCIDIYKEAITRYRRWKHLAEIGGSDAYRWRVRRNLPVGIAA